MESRSNSPNLPALESFAITGEASLQLEEKLLVLLMMAYLDRGCQPNEIESAQGQAETLKVWKQRLGLRYYSLTTLARSRSLLHDTKVTVGGRSFLSYSMTLINLLDKIESMTPERYSETRKHEVSSCYHELLQASIEANKLQNAVGLSIGAGLQAMTLTLYHIDLNANQKDLYLSFLSPMLRLLVLILGTNTE